MRRWSREIRSWGVLVWWFWWIGWLCGPYVCTLCTYVATDTADGGLDGGVLFCATECMMATRLSPQTKIGVCVGTQRLPALCCGPPPECLSVPGSSTAPSLDWLPVPPSHSTADRADLFIAGSSRATRGIPMSAIPGLQNRRIRCRLRDGFRPAGCCCQFAVLECWFWVGRRNVVGGLHARQHAARATSMGQCRLQTFDVLADISYMLCIYF
jgi:hypothetical protein